MTSAKYDAYVLSVDAFMALNEIEHSGPEFSEEDEGENAGRWEPFFSWSACGCCGSQLGGNREHYVFVCKDGARFTEDICTDCVYYLEYGKLDDQTMMEVEDDRKKLVKPEYSELPGWLRAALLLMALTGTGAGLAAICVYLANIAALIGAAAR